MNGSGVLCCSICYKNPGCFSPFSLDSIIRLQRSLLTEDCASCPHIKYSFGRTEVAYGSYKLCKILNLKACVFLWQLAPSDEWIWHLNEIYHQNLQMYFLILYANLLLLKHDPVLCKPWHLRCVSCWHSLTLSPFISENMPWTATEWSLLFSACCVRSRKKQVRWCLFWFQLAKKKNNPTNSRWLALLLFDVAHIFPYWLYYLQLFWGINNVL